MRSNWIVTGALVALVLLIGCGGDSKPKPAPTPTPTPTVAPNPPLNVQTLALSATSVRVFWGDNSSNETGFRVKRAIGSGSFSVVGTVAANVTTYDDTTAAAGTSYTYRVESFNSTGSTPAATDAPITTAAAPVTAPAAPTNLGAQAQSSTQVNLVWIDNANNEDGCKIEQSTTSGAGFTQIATVGANTVAYSATGLTAGTKYFFRVRAYNTASTPNSAYSNEANATTNAATGGAVTWVKQGDLPANFQADRLVVYGQTIYLNSAHGFYRSTDTGKTWVLIRAALSYQFTLAVNTWDSLTLYASGGSQGNGVIGSTNGGATWTALSNIPMGTTYGLAARGTDSVYAAGTSGVYRSLNSGQTWAQVNTQTLSAPGSQIHIAVAWSDWDRVYVVDGRGFVLTSADGGATWESWWTGAGPPYLNNLCTEAWGIAVDPLDDKKLYAATNTGLYKSTDAGKTWAIAGFAGQGVSTVRIDRVAPYPMYTLSLAGISMSTNGGATWTTINSGLPMPGAQYLVFDEESASTYFLKTTSNLYAVNSGALYKKQ